MVKEYYARLAASVDRNAKESKQQTRELESVLKDKKYYGSKALLCYVRFHGLYVFLREKKVKDRLRPLKQKLHRFKSLTASVNRLSEDCGRKQAAGSSSCASRTTTATGEILPSRWRKGTS